MRKIGQILKVLIPVIALGVLVVFLTGAATRTERNLATAMRYADELWNKGDMAVADEILTSDMVRHNDAVPGGVIPGREAMKQHITAVRTAWPDFHVTILDKMAKGDIVMCRWVWSGTFKAEYGGIPPNGKEMKVVGMSMFRFVGGKIAEEWMLEEDTSMFSQMGMKLVPAQAEAGK
jgi:steroid delta-isomerase-like uncharacterized protein